MNRPPLPALMRRDLGPLRPVDERSRAPRTSRPTLRALMSASAFAGRTVRSISEHNATKRRLALVIPAYNESLVLEHTISSAIAAGLRESDIYVVDDASSDTTAQIARRVIGDYNILTVGRSGKGLALHTVVKELQLTARYEWIHIADADGEFDQAYFRELYGNLDPQYAAATGYVSSLPGGYISNYRGFEYGIGMDVTRRFQSMTGVISIIPGPTSVFRSDVFDQLDFNAHALCEDFDVTLQIHRQNLGKIQFIPSAIARTQDPASFGDFIRQITRWNRGVLQMFVKHRVGRRLSKIDSYLSYQLAQNLMFAGVFFVGLPIITLLTGSFIYVALAFLSDVFTVWLYAMFAALRSGRMSTLESFPVTYALRWVQLGIFLKSFFEIYILRQYRLTSGVWETVQRRSNTAY